MERMQPVSLGFGDQRRFQKKRIYFRFAVGMRRTLRASRAFQQVLGNPNPATSLLPPAVAASAESSSPVRRPPDSPPLPPPSSRTESDAESLLEEFDLHRKQAAGEVIVFPQTVLRFQSASADGVFLQMFLEMLLLRFLLQFLLRFLLRCFTRLKVERRPSASLLPKCPSPPPPITTAFLWTSAAWGSSAFLTQSLLRSGGSRFPPHDGSDTDRPSL